MKMPWNDKTGLAKATAIFATLLLVSIGLCGANWVGVIALSSIRFGDDPGAAWKKILGGLTIAAFAEVIGMIVGALGLFIVAIAMAIRAIMQTGKNK